MSQLVITASPQKNRSEMTSDEMTRVDFAKAISLIYLHAKAELEDLKAITGIDFIDAAEQKLKIIGSSISSK